MGKIQKRQSQDISKINKGRNWLLDDDNTPFENKLVNKVSDKRAKTLNDYYNAKKKALYDPDYENSDEYTKAVTDRNRLINRTIDPYSGDNGATDRFSIASDVRKIQKNVKKTNKMLEKYRDNVIATGGSKKTEKSRIKLEKAIVKSNKILMEYADGRIEGYGFNTSDGNVYLNYGFKDNNKK